MSLDLRLEEKDKRDIQVEMQVRARGALDNRMLSTWARLYTSQIGRGGSYAHHRPAISIWIIGEAHFGDGSWFHVFEAHCRRTGHTLDPEHLPESMADAGVREVLEIMATFKRLGVATAVIAEATGLSATMIEEP